MKSIEENEKAQQELRDFSINNDFKFSVYT